jgi:hypothetical protein
MYCIHFVEVPRLKSSDQKPLPVPQLFSNCGNLVGTAKIHSLHEALRIETLANYTNDNEILWKLN